MELDKAKLKEVVEKIAYQQTAEDQNDDLFNKMGILNKYVQEQLTLTDVVKSDSELLVCPECKSTDCKTAIHTDYKECNKCYNYWEAN